MKIVGNIFDLPLEPPEGTPDPKRMLEQGNVLFWMAAMYYEYVFNTEHGIWDNSDTVSPSISPDDWIEADQMYQIECQATGFRYNVTVHSNAEVFEVEEASAGKVRIVFRLRSDDKPELADRYDHDYEDRIVVDRIDGDEKEVLRYFTMLKLSGLDPSFEVIAT